MQHDTICTILIAAVTAMLSALGAALLPAFSEVSQGAREVIQAIENINVMDDARLRLVCIAGSIGGALISVLLFAPLPRPKPLIAKLLASGLAGVLFSPMIIRWSSFTRDTDTTLAVSGTVALLSYSLMQMAVPVANRVAERWLGLRVDGGNYDVSEGRPRSKEESRNPK